MFQPSPMMCQGPQIVVVLLGEVYHADANVKSVSATELVLRQTRAGEHL